MSKEYFKVCVCGGRKYTNKKFVFHKLDLLLDIFPDNLYIINGAAGKKDKETGEALTCPDIFSTEWAIKRGVLYKEFPADWNKYPKAAGPIRNRDMLKYGFNLLIAFPGGTGTADMIKITKEAGIPVKEYKE